MRLGWLAALAALASAVAAAQGAPPQGKAEDGADVYAAHCAGCHGPHMDDGEFGPSLKSARIARTWGKVGPAALFGYAKANMPPNQAGQLSDQEYADVVALILQANAAPAAGTP